MVVRQEVTASRRSGQGTVWSNSDDRDRISAVNLSSMPIPMLMAVALGPQSSIEQLIFYPEMEIRVEGHDLVRCVLRRAT